MHRRPKRLVGGGGTSFASPIMAGIQALVNQVTGQKWGNPNPTYYQFANEQYGAADSSNCNSSKGTAVGNSCIFYDVTVGDNDGPCQTYPDDSFVPELFGSYNCSWGLPSSGTYGVLVNDIYQPVYTAGVGWDFATGIGTINAYNLVTNWCLSTLKTPTVSGFELCHGVTPPTIFTTPLQIPQLAK